MGRVFTKKIAAVILAAGASRRFGASKLLLSLPGGETLIRQVAKIAVDSGLSPILCVIGKDHQKIKQALAGLPLNFVHNSHWQSGMSSSVKTGINHLPDETDACIMLMGDQPFISIDLIHHLVELFQSGNTQVVIPVVGKQRTTPAILDRSTYDLIMKLEGDVGARALFSYFKVVELPWKDRRLLLDLDTPEDYQKMQELYDRSNSDPA